MMWIRSCKRLGFASASKLYTFFAQDLREIHRHELYGKYAVNKLIFINKKLLPTSNRSLNSNRFKIYIFIN
jgi:hypothetical protein